MSAPFVWGGYTKLVAAAATQAYFAKLGLPIPMLAWTAAVVIEFFGGLALLLGIQARVVGMVLALWCIATALVAHTDFADRNMQIHFLKNVIMAGGFLYSPCSAPARTRFGGPLAGGRLQPIGRELHL
jgi:putative oxidoreductase